MAKLNLCNKIYVSFGGGLQIGADYTWSNNELVSISKIVSINPSQSVTPQNGYAMKGELTPYKWEYYQFYVFTKIQLDVNISKRFSVFTALSGRIFVCKNNISEEVDMLELNYAPIKLTANIGLQAKLFK